MDSHLPEMLAKILRQKGNLKKCEHATKLVSVSSQKLIRKIFEMEEK